MEGGAELFWDALALLLAGAGVGAASLLDPEGELSADEDSEELFSPSFFSDVSEDSGLGVADAASDFSFDFDGLGVAEFVAFDFDFELPFGVEDAFGVEAAFGFGVAGEESLDAPLLFFGFGVAPAGLLDAPFLLLVSAP